LGRPRPFTGSETVNDKDALLCNFWRAVQADPEGVAWWGDSPVNENDLHARHAWIVTRLADFVPRIEGDPEYYDAQLAGWWCWGICCWIGSNFASGKGPWQLVDGQLKKRDVPGQGIHRQRIHLSNAGQGIHRQRIHLGNAGQGDIYDWMKTLAARLCRVRVCCGDWQRVLGPCPTTNHGVTGVFLDPPYTAAAGRNLSIYREDDLDIGHQVRDWAVAHGHDPLLRIALCGYATEYRMPDDWEVYAWSAGDSYGSATHSPDHRHQERIWFSPPCRIPDLFTDSEP
jgi:hypothetical protein